jgi:hypothetical protein
MLLARLHMVNILRILNFIVKRVYWRARRWMQRTVMRSIRGEDVVAVAIKSLVRRRRERVLRRCWHLNVILRRIWRAFTRRFTAASNLIFRLRVLRLTRTVCVRVWLRTPLIFQHWTLTRDILYGQILIVCTTVLISVVVTVAIVGPHDHEFSFFIWDT